MEASLLPSQKGNGWTWKRTYPFICLAHKQSSKSILISSAPLIIQSSLVHSRTFSFWACLQTFSLKSLVVMEEWVHAISAGHKWQWGRAIFLSMSKAETMISSKIFKKRAGGEETSIHGRILARCVKERLLSLPRIGLPPHRTSVLASPTPFPLWGTQTQTNTKARSFIWGGRKWSHVQSNAILPIFHRCTLKPRNSLVAGCGHKAGKQQVTKEPQSPGTDHTSRKYSAAVGNS